MRGKGAFRSLKKVVERLSKCRPQRAGFTLGRMRTASEERGEIVGLQVRRPLLRLYLRPNLSLTVINYETFPAIVNILLYVGKCFLTENGDQSQKTILTDDIRALFLGFLSLFCGVGCGKTPIATHSRAGSATALKTAPFFFIKNLRKESPTAGPGDQLSRLSSAARRHAALMRPCASQDA